MLPKQASNHQPLLELETDPSNAEMEVFLNTLEAPTYPHMQRIVELRPRGIIVLEGSDGVKMHKSDEGRGALPPSNPRHHPPPREVQMRPVDAFLGMWE